MSKFLVVLAMFLPIQAMAQAVSFSVASHSLSGSYEKMLGEIISSCSNDKFEITQAKGITGGGTGNLEALANNKAQAAMVRSDVVTAITQADASYKRFQTLVTLYPEPIHILVLRNSKSKKKGRLSFGTVDFNSLAEISADFLVGGGGGTIYTLKILKGMGGASYNIASFADSKSMMTALDNGEIAAAAFVGAAPLPNLLALDKTKYKLIPIGESIGDKVKGIYSTQTLNYDGLSDSPVHTLASKLVVLTRRFSGQQKVDAQRHFRTCLTVNLARLQDDGSPSWQQVQANDHGVLDWYEIPGK
jgi:TRAP-type uncharacterized transport system substrate-binding protein